MEGDLRRAESMLDELQEPVTAKTRTYYGSGDKMVAIPEGQLVFCRLADSKGSLAEVAIRVDEEANQLKISGRRRVRLLPAAANGFNVELIG